MRKRTGDAYLPHDSQEPFIVFPKNQERNVGLGQKKFREYQSRALKGHTLAMIKLR
jgi:hypothetical protein